MIKVKEIKMTEALYQKERDLRNKILLRPIGIADFGWEMHDKESLHFVAVKAEEVVGCVVLYLESGIERARLMQMAVDESMQRQGVGKLLIELLLSTAKARGIKEVTCHARSDAVQFYLKVNFEIVGEPFDEVGVEHFNMRYNMFSICRSG